MRAKRAHALTLAETPPHPAAFCNVPPMFPVIVCVRVCAMFALSVSFHRAGSCFMVFPALLARTVIPYVSAENVAVGVVKT